MSIPEVIEKLIGAGWSEVALAKKVGISQASINRIRRGKQRPGYDAGAKLMALAPTPTAPSTAATGTPAPEFDDDNHQEAA